jgi:hypothetical protein
LRERIDRETPYRYREKPAGLGSARLTVDEESTSERPDRLDPWLSALKSFPSDGDPRDRA